MMAYQYGVLLWCFTSAPSCIYILIVFFKIAPKSQYAPLSVLRRSTESNMFTPPILLELEDSRGIEQFLRNSSFEERSRACKITVMPRLNLWSLQTLSAHTLLNDAPRRQSIRHERDVTFIMIQLLSALKFLQSDGIEQLSWNFEEFLLSYDRHDDENDDALPHVLLLHETIAEDHEESRNHTVPVCRYALRALNTLLHMKMDRNTPIIHQLSPYSSSLQIAADILYAERASSLTEAKNVLEYTFWVVLKQYRSSYVDNVQSKTTRSQSEHAIQLNDEFSAKLWLDGERAMYVDRLIKLFIENGSRDVTIEERCHVHFLLSVTPRALCQASHLLNADQHK